MALALIPFFFTVLFRDTLSVRATYCLLDAGDVPVLQPAAPRSQQRAGFALLRKEEHVLLQEQRYLTNSDHLGL